MHTLTLHAWLLAAGFVLAAFAAAYSVLSVIAPVVLDRRRPPRTRDAEQPPVTILKPLCGEEFELFEQLRSFCLQDYPSLQIVFGVNDATDPAVNSVRRLQREFPYLDLQLVINPARRGSNRKVANLINMMPLARHEFLVIADSDIRVGPNYVSAVVAPLLRPGVGLVTCLYRARPRAGLWSTLGALFIDEWFIPSVRVAAMFGSQAFTSGATIALHRQVLANIGGFGALADQLADDFKVGERVRASGLCTVIADITVETVVDEPTLSSMVGHQLRWLRTIRSIEPVGYAFCVLSFGVPVAVIGAAMTGWAATALGLLALTVAARFALHFVRPDQRLRTAFTQLWLLPIHDLLVLSLWCWSFVAPEVTWGRGRYRVERDGSLRPLS